MIEYVPRHLAPYESRHADIGFVNPSYVGIQYRIFVTRRRARAIHALLTATPPSPQHAAAKRS